MALPGTHIQTQVSMLALLEPRNKRDWIAKRKIGMWRLDYVMTDTPTGEIVCVIELDDSSHIGRRDKDAERDGILRACGYKVLRCESRAKPSVAKIASEVLTMRSESTRNVAPPGIRRAASERGGKEL